MSNEITKIIDRLSCRESLTQDESTRLFQIIMNGGATPAHIAAALIALKTKGETIDEISGAVSLLRYKMTKVVIPDELRKSAIDVCGTGGDKKGTFNISTAVAFVVAGCGVPVAKHGNKAISSKSGSADVLTELGANIEITPEQAAETLQKAGIVFLFAPYYHKSMMHVAHVRAELGTRTIFNVLGPLCNPALVEKQIVGVYSDALVVPVCYVLKNLGSKSAMVVHGADGMDEISTCDKTYIAELHNNKIHEYVVSPEDLGIQRAKEEMLVGGDARQNAIALKEILNGAKNEYRDAVIVNAAAALKVAGKAVNLVEGMEMAAESLDSGMANISLKKLVEVSNSFEN